MTKVLVRYRTVVEEIIELPDKYDKDIRTLETDGISTRDEDVEVSIDRLYNYVDTKIPHGATLYGIYNENFTFAYCET